MIKLFDGFYNKRSDMRQCNVSPSKVGGAPLSRDTAIDSRSFCDGMNSIVRENGVDALAEQVFDLALEYNKLAKTLNDIERQMRNSADYMEKAIKNCHDISGAVKLQEAAQ